MKKIVFLMMLCSGLIQAQEHAWVYFKDKPNAQTFINNPTTMLSQRALDRRTNQSIALDTKDTPVESAYVSSVNNSTGITLKARSRWMNAVHVTGSQTDITNLQNLAAVDSIQFANKNIANVNPPVAPQAQQKITKINKLNNVLTYNYGSAANQTTMLGVDDLHNAGYEGVGYQIAVIDAGFSGVNTAGAFSHLLDANHANGEILGGYDFVNQSTNFYFNTGSTHGTNVLSTIGAIKENEFVGTAPKASFYLFVSEDPNSETPLEESLWVQAAECADSLGVDIINTSLGYSEFDESKYDYTYADMDGTTTFITRGANIAASKGMLLVNSMGNSGTEAWHYLTAPADAENIISVGAVNANKTLTSFSSFGPSADSRTKPETLAQGGSVYVVSETNTVYASDGTSFSGPIIAGVVACLWQAYPTKTNVEIRQMVMENSDTYASPTAQGGYGVLDISSIVPLSFPLIKKETNIRVVVSPKTKTITFKFDESKIQEFNVQMYSAMAREVINKNITVNYKGFSYAHMRSGVYFFRFSTTNETSFLKLFIE